MKTYHEIDGDGGSRVVEQITTLQATIAERMAGVRRRLAVGSGKGGVGKSTLTAQLAAALHARGRSVAILDADLNGPSQARLNGLDAVPLAPGPQGRLTLPRSRSGVGVVSLGGLVRESAAVDFDSVALGDSHTWRATREFSFLAQLLASVEWGRIDVLLIDLPPGAERTFQYAEFLGPATDFVLVTVPSELARGVVARSRAALDRTPNRILGEIENMSGYWCAGCNALRPLFPAAATEAGGTTLLGRVPFDPELAAACDRGRPLPDDPARPAVRALHAIAARLDQLTETRP